MAHPATSKAAAAAPPADWRNKVQRIFNHFDANADGGLSRDEIAAMVAALNPRVRFTPPQMDTILDELSTSYQQFFLPGRGLSLAGLERSYNDGAGDVDRDFRVVSAIAANASVPPPATGSSAPASSPGVVLEPPKAAAMAIETGQEAFANHMAIGVELYYRQKYEESLISFRQACELQPANPRPHLFLGNALRFLGRDGEAKAELVRAVVAAEAAGDDDPLLPEIHVSIGMLLEKDPEMLLHACDRYRQAAALSPGDRRVLHLLRDALIRAGDYKTLAEAMAAAVASQPDDAELRSDLGLALLAAGNDGTVYLRKAFEDDGPRTVEKLYELGDTLMASGRGEEAAKAFDMIVQLEKKEWRAQLNKAAALTAQGRGDEATAALRDALRSGTMKRSAEGHLKRKIAGEGGADLYYKLLCSLAALKL